jgi:hypothetical protein
VTVCYVRDLRDRVFGIDERAKRLDIEYVEVRERHSFDVRIWRALKGLVHDRRIDIVHSHDYKTDLLALLLARSLGVIPLSTAHGWTGQSARERWLTTPSGSDCSPDSLECSRCPATSKTISFAMGRTRTSWCC